MIQRLRVGSIGENCYLLPLDDGGSRKGSCIIVDPGDEHGRILDAIDSRSLVPALIVLTHGHFDHCAAIPPLRSAFEELGLDVPIAIHRLDAAYLGALGEETNRRLFESINALEYFKSVWLDLPEADILLEDGDSLLESGWRVIHSPGHSAGSICLHHEKAGILVSGDTLFRDGVGRTDGPDADTRLLQRSIAERLFSLPGKTLVFPGHGEPTDIARESGLGI